MPDIRFFNGPIGRPFSRFDYMKQQPTLKACNGILSFFESCRKNGLKLDPCHLEDEKRAYLTIKNNEYVNYSYKWLDRI